MTSLHAATAQQMVFFSANTIQQHDEHKSTGLQPFCSFLFGTKTRWTLAYASIWRFWFTQSYFLLYHDGSDYVPVELWLLMGPLPTPRTIYGSIWSSGGIIQTEENRKTHRRTSFSATLSTTNPTWAALGAKPAHRVEGLAADRVSFTLNNRRGT
jgi:hypothetical protein